MSDDKPKGRLGELVELAKNTAKKNVDKGAEQSNDEPKRQATPESGQPKNTRSTPVEDGPLELSPDREDPIGIEPQEDGDEPKKLKTNPFAEMSFAKRMIVVGVAAIIVVGFFNTKTTTKDFDPSQPPKMSAQERQASDDLDGFESIPQGDVSKDPNAIDVRVGADNNTSDKVHASEDPADPTAPPVDMAVAEDAMPEASQTLGAPVPLNDAVIQSPPSEPSSPAPIPSSNNVITFDDQPSQPSFGNSGSENVTAPDEDLFGSPAELSMTGSGENISVSKGSELVTLRNKVGDMAQSLSSIESKVEKSNSNNQALRRQIENLMRELEAKSELAAAIGNRPEITDLVIFNSARNCSSCVPHAVFRWNGTEQEVGDGLSWNGFNIAIRGDQLTLTRNDDQFHYWYR